jgi:hypothetical protein
VADLAAFIQQYNGRCVDFDSAYGAQCVDLVQLWLQANGFPRMYGNAIAAAGQHWPGATWIANGPSNYPSPGDCVVWGTAVGSAGHIAVAISADAGSFVSFDQNWPIGSCCHRQNHNYNGVLGWQALHVSAPAPPPPPPTPVPPPPVPIVPPVVTQGPVAPALLLVAVAGLAGWTYWHHRRGGIPVTPQTLLQDVREGVAGGEQLARRGLGDLESGAAAIRRRLPV